jgi:hypothetical protein
MIQSMLQGAEHMFNNLLGLLQTVTQVPYPNSGQLHHLVRHSSE